VRVVVPLSVADVGEKVPARAGGATTMMDELPVLPAPPCVEVTAEVVLFFCPAAVPVTLMEKVQELDCVMVAPERLTTFVPCVALIEPPPQEPESPLGVVTTIPAGNVSEKPIPVSEEDVLLF